MTEKGQLWALHEDEKVENCGAGVVRRVLDVFTPMREDFV